VISRYFAGLLFKVVNRIWKDVDRPPFINKVVEPLATFVVIFVSIVSLHKLKFPEDLKLEIYNVTLDQIISAAGSAILIIAFIWLLLRIIDFIATILEKKANLTPDHTDNQLVVFFKDFFKAVTVIIGIMLVLKFAFGLAIGSLLTGLSIVGAAIALSLREILENIIASFIIFFDKPFTVGDLIKVQNVTGTIEKIGLRSTRIRTDHKTLVSVPNKQMVDSIVDNLSLRTQRRADLRIEIDLETSTEKIETLISATKKLLDRKEIEASNCMLADITGQAFLMTIEYYTAPITIAEYNALKEEISMLILKRMETEQIQIAGARTDIKIFRERRE
jgi:MscS family membrane protein